MVEAPYYSSSQVMLFINGYHVDDACAIEWQAADPKTPIYGYNDQDFRRVVPGRSLVQGTLGIYFRYFGYLTNVIQATKDITNNLPETLRELQLIKHLRNVEDLMQVYSRADAPDEKVQLAANVFQNALETGALSKPLLDRAAQDFMETLKKAHPGWRNLDRLDHVHPANYTRPGRATPSSNLPDGFNIVVRFGNLHNMSDPSRTLLLEGVHLAGQSTVVDAQVPDGGTPLREVYPFIARSIRPYRLYGEIND